MRRCCSHAYDAILNADAPSSAAVVHESLAEETRRPPVLRPYDDGRCESDVPWGDHLVLPDLAEIVVAVHEERVKPAKPRVATNGWPVEEVHIPSVGRLVDELRVPRKVL